MKKATAKACANIALVKYWGKRDSALNLPGAGSVSLTLDALVTTTTVEFDESITNDELFLDDAPASTGRLSPWLDLVRNRAQITTRARVKSSNAFPTSSGLASSASAYAALALAATTAAGVKLSLPELSELARRGSGSAARSIFPGFVQLHAGKNSDGSDCVAQPITGAEDWPLCMVIAIVGGGVKKSISSRNAMDHCAETSPLYKAWLQCVPGDIKEAVSAISSQNLERLGAVTTYSAMAMHAAAMASRPPIRYWQPETLACLNVVQELASQGLHAYPTMDAGPHVKVLTTRKESETVKAALAALPAVTQVLISNPGPGATLVETDF